MSLNPQELQGFGHRALNSCEFGLDTITPADGVHKNEMAGEDSGKQLAASTGIYGGFRGRKHVIRSLTVGDWGRVLGHRPEVPGCACPWNVPFVQPTDAIPFLFRMLIIKKDAKYVHLQDPHELASIIPKFGWIDCMSVLEKELVVVIVRLHERTEWRWWRDWWRRVESRENCDLWASLFFSGNVFACKYSGRIMRCRFT